MKKSTYLILLGVILIAGVSFSLFSNDDTTVEDNKGLYQNDADEVSKEAVEVVAADDGSINANHLYIPWTINKSGSSFFLSQREGSVIQIDGEFGLVEVQDVTVSEDIHQEGEGGFLGFTLAPDFDTSKMAFAYHTYQKDGKTLNRIVSLKLDDNKWNEEAVLVDGIPGGEINNGGRILVGPDGMLYATTGDTGKGENAQSLKNLAGKILRMELDGDIPKDNPYNNSYIYSFGHRNPQGLAWDNKGKLYSSEHGESGHDEINLIEAGKNYGWPTIQGDEEKDNMVKPLLHSGDSTWAPSGMAFKDGKLFIASLAGKKIFTYDIATSKMNDFFGDAGRLRDVMIERDELFTITNNHDSRGNPNEKDDRLLQISLTEKASTN
ncbi:PQQ-dependent sugar dehydrogenase [Fredinandcohnia sp. 179-A 10B2 NHS]|uniref:PQQ-dependent sugar dehydrogenase n=1 Tax=Fredinandcohnia sp. 179-A 10B2 NHS TaxID=3235176 RepID=UPI00399F73C0